nr:EAL domain-containing protein [Pseudobutyrivibrio sp.]
IDERTQLFNEDAFKRYLLELERMKHTSMLAFTIKNYTELREIYGANQMDAGISMIGNFLKKSFPKAICFYHRKGRFVIMTKPDVNQDAMIEIISERFGKSWAAVDVELYLEVCFAKMDACYINYDKDTIIYTLGNVASRMETDIENTIYLITDTDLHQMEDSKNVRVALENAVRDNKVEVFLQPIVDAGDYSLVGAEALCRIRDAKGNIVPPGEFISVAERNGRIIQLGELVFEETCRFLATYDIYAMGISWINVNLSALQFLKSDLPENFEHIAKEYGVPPARIHLEITEAAIIDEATMEAQISRFISKGFAFSLDDYGTGYSNASRINKFAFTNIKIDMSVVWDYINSPNIILPMMIKSFKRMGYTVTAEGIESEQMGQSMRELGCDYLQGKHFAMPLPIPEFIERYGE